VSGHPFAPVALGARAARVLSVMEAAQATMVDAFAGLEATAGAAAGAFGEHVWRRTEGGGGRARIIEGGAVFERGGVNVSAVTGARVPASLAARHPGTEGKPFFATGVSLVVHPRNPYVPAFHANFRYFEVGGGDEPLAWWFGGGDDLAPTYQFAEDARHFHRTLAAWCAAHPHADYPAWKATCDAYFTLPHRREMRGIGGVFFDELSDPTARRDDAQAFEADLACVQDGGAALPNAYVPIATARVATPYGERERAWQGVRRGRYVEFNLVVDRGTLFGLQTGGNVEAILMSMPPIAQWRFDHHPEPGSAEAAALAFYQSASWT
jgi:coproporphyrinogen III oxidase